MASVPPLRKMPGYSDSSVDPRIRSHPKFTAYLPGGPKYTGAMYESLGYGPEVAGLKPRKRAETPAELRARIADLEARLATYQTAQHR